jgi:predicted nucleotidyltransferase component of viral defense system
MLEVLKQQIAPFSAQSDKLNKLRELLQIIILKNIYDKRVFNNIAFIGGTALRIIFGLNRFSEDLDFSLIKQKGYDFAALIENIRRFCGKNNLPVDIETKSKASINSAFLKFSTVLQELELSRIKNQKLSVKLEIDTNPPAGWQTADFPLNNIYLLSLTAFDLPSMFATKLHACFFRKYTKGRDFYDLIWYLTKKIQPNILLLNNAAYQTEHKHFNITKANLADFLAQRLEQIDFAAARKDVARFLFNPEELEFINKKFIESLLVKI